MEGFVAASRALRSFPKFAVVVVSLPQHPWPRYREHFMAAWANGSPRGGPPMRPPQWCSRGEPKPRKTGCRLPVRGVPLSAFELHPGRCRRPRRPFALVPPCRTIRRKLPARLPPALAQFGCLWRIPCQHDYTVSRIGTEPRGHHECAWLGPLIHGQARMPVLPPLGNSTGIRKVGGRERRARLVAT